MELVYLWVKGYKNIKEENFNFSSPYNYTYLEDDKSIVREKNTAYFSKLFGDNIRVSALVGKNGSGKSSILEVIGKLQVGDIDQELEQGIVCIFKNSNDEEVVYSNIEVRDHTVHALNTIITSFSTIYYSASFSNGYFDNYIDEFKTPLLQRFAKEDFPHSDEDYASKYLRVQTLLNLVFNSNRFFTHNPSSSGYRNKNAFFIKEMQFNYKIAKIISILDFLKNYKNLIPFKIHNNPKVTISIGTGQDANRLGWNNTFLEKTKLFFQIPESFYADSAQEEYMRSVDIDNYNDSLQNFLSILERFVDQSIASNDKIELSLENAISLIMSYKELYAYNRNFKEQFIEIDFRNLSSGEENFILIFHLLLNATLSLRPDSGEDKSVIILLDEIENNLHPSWQKLVVTYVLRFFRSLQSYFLSTYNVNYSFHLILASHSPFILSDLSKGHVVFLNNDENGNCKVVEGLENMKQTFGANIHTLLSDGFFMDSGLMGYFALEKIRNVHRFLKSEDSELDTKEEAQEIINIIGEPVIRKQLQILYDESFVEDDAIEKEIAQLQSRLDELKARRESE